MVSQSINLGPLRLFHNAPWEGAVLLDAALVEGGVVAYLREIRQTGGSPRIKLAATQTGDPAAAGPEFTAAVETYAEALTFSEAGGDSIVLKGPGHSDNAFADGAEPYFGIRTT